MVLPAVPSDSVVLLGVFKILPADTDLAMMELFSGWHPTIFTFGLSAASTLATPTIQGDNALMSLHSKRGNTEHL